MQKTTYTVRDPYGLHARPAGLIVKEAQRYSAEVTLTNERNGKSASAKGLFALMGLEITQGDRIPLVASGTDEQEALRAVGKIIEERVG